MTKGIKRRFFADLTCLTCVLRNCIWALYDGLFV